MYKLAKARLVNNYFCDYDNSIQDYDACMSLFITYLSTQRCMYNPNHEHTHPYVKRMKKEAKDPHKSIAKIYANNPEIHGGVFQGKLFPEGGVDPTFERWAFNLGPKINDSFPSNKRNISSRTSDTTVDSVADRIKLKRQKENEERAATLAIIENQKRIEKEAKARLDAEKAQQRLEKKKQMEEKAKVQEQKQRQKVLNDKRKADEKKRKEQQKQSYLNAQPESLSIIADEEDVTSIDPTPRTHTNPQVRTRESAEASQNAKRTADEREAYELRLKELEKREKEFNDLLELDRRERELNQRMELARQQQPPPKPPQQQQSQQSQQEQQQQSRTPYQQHERMQEQGFRRQSPFPYYSPHDMYDSPEMFQANHSPYYSRDVAYQRQQPVQRPPSAPKTTSMESHNGISFVFNTNNYQSSSNNQY